MRQDKTKTSEYDRKRRFDRHLQGLCSACGLRPYINPANPSSSCKECLAVSRARKAQKRELAICRACSEPALKDKVYCLKHLQSTKISGLKHRRRYRNLCLNHYGGKCNCCGESNPIFLQLDHISGGGARHKQSRLGPLDQWLVTHNFPSEQKIQVLCANCHQAKTILGVCPFHLIANYGE